jgi:hypothetical protein
MLASCHAGEARERPFLRAYTTIFAVAIALDALLNGPLSPLPKGSAWETAAGIVFVIVGDLRYFVAVERCARGRLDRRALANAVGLSLVVPAASEVLRRVLGSVDIRATYLGYELMFLALAIALRTAVLPRRLAGVNDPERSVAVSLTAYEIVQYALWAGADIVILATRSDLGFAPRLAANLMYYAFFVPFAFARLKRIRP